MAEIIYYLVAFLFHSTLLLVVLWIMIKLQGMNYSFLGLLGSAAAAGALDMLPYVGHVLAVITLYICITKMTRASMFPDAAFTVAVGYALMFAAKVLAFTALVGDLRPSALDQTTDSSSQPPAIVAAAGQPVSTNTAPPLPAAKSNEVADFVNQLTITGVTENGNNSSISIHFNGKDYLLFCGDTATLQAKDRNVLLRLEQVKNKILTFSIRGQTASRSYK